MDARVLGEKRCDSNEEYLCKFRLEVYEIENALIQNVEWGGGRQHFHSAPVSATYLLHVPLEKLIDRTDVDF